MEIRQFIEEEDLEILEEYLRDRYLESGNTVSWLPERLHDILYRVAALESDDGGKRSRGYIYLWEEDGDIVACILPDGENIYTSIRNGYEYLFPSMVDFSEKNCLPLFNKAEDGSIKFWIAVSNSLGYAVKELGRLGYRKFDQEEHQLFIYPMEQDVTVEVPEGYRFMYGEEYPDEVNKWNALRLGFHDDLEGTGYVTGMDSYNDRKRSSMYPDSFECIVIKEDPDESNDVCAYSFVYVDKKTGTALIEPVSTREKYRRKGLGTAMMNGAVRRLKEMGIRKCYVGAYGWRTAFYGSVGFEEEDAIGFWYRTLN